METAEATTRIGFDLSALDPSFKAHAHRGIGRYVRNLHAQFKALGFFSKNNFSKEGITLAPFDHRDFIGDTIIDQILNNVPVGRHTLKQQLLYPLRLSKSVAKDMQYLHFPAHMDAPSWCPTPYILTVLDLIPLKFEHLYKQDRPTLRFKFARWLEIQAIKNAALILAISECTAKDVHEILGIPKERILITPLGVDLPITGREDTARKQELLNQFQLSDTTPCILYVGGIDQRKNWKVMLDAIKILNEQRRQRALPPAALCMAGKIENDLQYPKLLKYAEEIGVSFAIKILGYVPDQDLAVWQSHCKAFFFPSLYEGFGLPPLEAMAAGLPVVASNSSCMPEVLGDAALLEDPQEASKFATALSEVLDNHGLAEQLKEAGKKRAAQFTWEKTAQLTLEAYKHISK